MKDILFALLGKIFGLIGMTMGNGAKADISTIKAEVITLREKMDAQAIATEAHEQKLDACLRDVEIIKLNVDALQLLVRTNELKIEETLRLTQGPTSRLEVIAQRTHDLANTLSRASGKDYVLQMVCKKVGVPWPGGNP